MRLETYPDNLIPNPVILPSRWRGQTNCVVGPFETAKAAIKHFAAAELQRAGARINGVFQLGRSWYLQLGTSL